MRRRPFVLAVPFLLRSWASQGAEHGPQPPCAGVAASPAFAPPDRPPATLIWSESELQRLNWSPPDCLGWGAARTRLVVALAGEFTFIGSLDQLLDRFGDFATYKSIQYWSVTRQQWQPLVISAGLVGHEPPKTNLTASDLRPRASYEYFEQDRLGTVHYLMTVLERSEGHVVLVSRNTTAIHTFLGTLFEPGALEATMILERHGPDRWGCWQATRAGAGAGMLAISGPDSYVNRLAALFGYIAQRPVAR